MAYKETTKKIIEEDKIVKKEVEHDFLKKPWYKFGKKQEKILKEPLLELMTNKGVSLTYEGVEPGVFNYKIGKEIKTILLDAGKLYNWKYAGNMYKKWYCHEDEATPYPLKVQHDSRMLRMIMDKLRINYENADIRKFDKDMVMKWLTYAAIGVAILWFLFYSPFGKQLTGGITSTIGGVFQGGGGAPKAILP